eukprot:12892056-Alexandrium_andersonii.AAC.1
MSASLVGSEMCIRDSPNPLKPREADKLPGLRWPPSHTSRKDRLGPLEGCLLYTSDAADDM